MRQSGWLASGMLARLVGMLGSAAFADAVSERQALMKQADAALKDARRAAPAQAVDMARFLQQAFKTAPGLFAPGTEGGRAKPEVWSNRAAFNAAMGAAQKAADDIRAAAKWVTPRRSKLRPTVWAMRVGIATVRSDRCSDPATSGVAHILVRRV